MMQSLHLEFLSVSLASDVVMYSCKWSQDKSSVDCILNPQTDVTVPVCNAII
jgi:hypothetical protein